ncbi:MAG TPA: hypothetical protein VJJ26_01705 [Candidatus Babeliales bacterium]|nr:hypothetical protein [Candidatus Babeliales bacterium]
MIDTIVLTLPQESFTITNPDAFTPSAQWALNNKTYALRGIISKQNPTKKELALGVYKPRLTLFPYYAPSFAKSYGGHCTASKGTQHPITPLSITKTLLKIELSLPKLLFGNNFEELTQKQFPDLVQKLCTTLHSMGIATDVETLTNADVSGIHFSKNIPLTDGSIPYHYISKIEQVNIKLSLDINQTDYRNKGHSYKWHSNSYELVFYDKIRDLGQAKKSDKRSLEKDNAIQLHLYDTLHNKKMFEVLRMEARLNNRRKIQQIMKQLGIKTPLTFKGLFKTNIARKVLLHYLDEIENARPALLDFKVNNAKSLLVALIFNNPTLSPRRILQLYGMKLALDQINIRELRTMFGAYNKRSWYRLIADMKDVNITRQPNLNNPFKVIRNCLEEFKSATWTFVNTKRPFL